MPAALPRASKTGRCHGPAVAEALRRSRRICPCRHISRPWAGRHYWLRQGRAQIPSGGQLSPPICPSTFEHYGVAWLEPLLWELLKAAHNQARSSTSAPPRRCREESAAGHPAHRPSGSGRLTPNCSAGAAQIGMRRTLMGQHADSVSACCSMSADSRPKKQIERIRPVLDAMRPRPAGASR